MITIDKNTLIIGGAVVVGLYVITKLNGGVKGVTKAVTKTAVSAADGVVAGAVIGVAEVFGVPETKLTDCEKAQKEGRTWDASFLCPAGTWIKGLFN